MKNIILKFANDNINSKDRIDKKLSKILLQNINYFNCYYCLDTKKTWKYRDNLPWSKLDGRGEFDIIGCSNCNFSKWISCSHTNEIVCNNIKVFKKDNVNKNDIIFQLKKYFADRINTNDEKWILTKTKEFQKSIKSTELNVNLKDFSNLVSAAIEIYSGNLIGLGNTIKDLTFKMSVSMTQENDQDKTIRKFKTDDNKDGFLILNVSKELKDRSVFTNLYKSKKYIYKLKYLILIPENQAAKTKCEEIVSDNVSDVIESMSDILDL